MSLILRTLLEMSILSRSIGLCLITTISALATWNFEMGLVNILKVFMNPGILQPTHIEIIERKRFKGN